MIAKLAGIVLPRVIRMSAKRSYLIILLLLIGCQQAGIGQDQPVQPAGSTSEKTEADTQLQLNKEALTNKGSSEQMRINAANLLLFSANPLARTILLDTLKQAENRPARVAVCKALSQTRAAQKAVGNKEDFVQPLFDMLTADDSVVARIAAEATLIFEYGLVSERFEKMVKDSLRPAKDRLSTIYALKLHPDMRAIFVLIELLDDPESQVAAAAEEALHSLGIPVGEDAKTRERTISELKLEGLAAFLRTRLIHQETEIRRLETELNLWRERYLSEVSKRYGAISDDAAKSKFLAEHLGSSEKIVRLWALEKLKQWRQGSTKPKLSAELERTLVSLISDQNRDVRLRTANLLSLMGELNSAQYLLEQLKIEQDDEVRMELFVALGEACFYASLPDSGVKVPEEVRKQALELAAQYLSQQEPKKARKGADVVRKLLEQDGLTSGEVNRYLALLAGRYNEQKNKADGALRGELLSAMAGLCADRSICRAQAAKSFKPLFDEALRDETDLVRQAAVDGLIYIDKVGALKKLRKDFANDPSIVIRRKLIDLAGEVGSHEDLGWLAEKIGTTGENEPAWQAMLGVFKRSGMEILSEWVAEFDSESDQSKFSDEQKIAFFEIARQKAVSENRPKMLSNIRENLAWLYSGSGQFEQAAKYFGLLREAAQTIKEKEAILPDLLNAYLRWPNVKSAKDLVANCLLEKDLDPNNAIVSVIDNYLSKPPPGADPHTVLEALFEIQVRNPEGRPMWQKRLEHWADRFGKTKESGEPKGTDR